LPTLTTRESSIVIIIIDTTAAAADTTAVARVARLVRESCHKALAVSATIVFSFFFFYYHRLFFAPRRRATDHWPQKSFIHRNYLSSPRIFTHSESAAAASLRVCV
jgi:hypothetical protein